MGDYDKLQETDWQCDCHIKAWNSVEDNHCLYCGQEKKEE